MSIGWVFHPNSALFVIPLSNPDLVVAFYPISILAVTGHPNTFLSPRNPLTKDFPVARGHVNHRRMMIDVGSVNHGRMVMDIAPVWRDNR